MSYILLIVGFVLLVKGADYFVIGSSNLAKYLRISTLVIGLTVVSLGTSAPEVVVSLVASIRESNDIAVSNVIGSNMFNLLMVLGVSAIVRPLKTKKQILTRDFIVSIIVTIILLVFVSDKVLNSSTNIISKGEGLTLLVAFGLYIYIMIMTAKKEKYLIREYHNLTVVDILMLLSGLLAVILGGELVVRSAREIALSWGVSETLVGLTIVSIGTSLPEFVTSLVAAKKGEVDIAIGNVIGSNIYNILLVIGLSSSVSSIPVNNLGIIDIFILIITSIICYVLIRKDNKINRKKGIMMVFMYIAFLIYIINR